MIEKNMVVVNIVIVSNACLLMKNCRGLCWFPRAPVANRHQVGGFE